MVVFFLGDPQTLGGKQEKKTRWYFIKNPENVTWRKETILSQIALRRNSFQQEKLHSESNENPDTNT